VNGTVPLEYEVVIPSVGRPSLLTLLESLAAAGEPQPALVHVVDGRGRGPAAARNVGWRAASAPWVVFLDDDVVVSPGWCAELADDLARLEPRAAGSQGRIRVPTGVGAGVGATAGGDWARNVTKLETALWATADMAYRRRVLAAVGGFDERFPRAYREDADLGLRVVGAGWTIEPGRRVVLHPVRPERPWVSVRNQRGNADDALMRRLHGPGWQHRARAGRGRRPLHLVASAGWLLAAAGSAVAIGAVVATGFGGRRGAPEPVPAIAGAGRASARAGAVVGAGLTAELFAHRLRGARHHAVGTGGRVGPGEIGWLAATSAAIPPAAAWHTVRGWVRARRLVPSPPPRPGGSSRHRPEPPAAVLFDRDGTLVHDVPYNGDPARVELRPDTLPALARLRAAGVKVGLVTNQSGVALGLIRPDQVEAVNTRLAELAGPFDAVVWCPHGPGDGCSCRKPAPGMVLAAARALGVPPERCAVVGDTGADVGAALAAGARGVLVPNDVTAFDEIEAAAETAADLVAAVERLLGPPLPGTTGVVGATGRAGGTGRPPLVPPL